MNEELVRRTFRNEFVRDIWIAWLAAAETPDEPEALREMAFDAWSRNDRLAFLAAARGLRAGWPLKPKMAERMAIALLELRLAEEAHELLSEGEALEGREFGWRLMRARAALMSGLVAAASWDLASARELARDDHEQAQVEALKHLVDLPLDPGAADPTLQAWRCLHEEQPARASIAFARALRSFRIKAARRKLGAICEAAFAILRRATPQWPRGC